MTRSICITSICLRVCACSNGATYGSLAYVCLTATDVEEYMLSKHKLVPSNMNIACRSQTSRYSPTTPLPASDQVRRVKSPTPQSQNAARPERSRAPVRAHARLCRPDMPYNCCNAQFRPSDWLQHLPKQFHPRRPHHEAFPSVLPQCQDADARYILAFTLHAGR